MKLLSTQRKRSFSLYIGNTLEFYDYSIYGFLIPYIAPLFFPGKSYVASLVAGYGVFALGIYARIVGAMVFGHIGDRYSRRKAIFLSISVMSLSTAAIGCLPDYKQVGLVSTVLLTLLRVLQGVSLGGAYTGSLVYLSENSLEKNKSIEIGKVHLAGSLGWFSGSLMSFLFTAEEIGNLWRIPFLLGILGCFIGLACQRLLHEDRDLILKAKEKIDKNIPILFLLQNFLPRVIYISGISALISCTFHMFYIVPTALLPKFLGMSYSYSSSITTLGIGVYTIMLLPMGWLASRIFPSKLMIFSSSLLVVLSYPLFKLLISNMREKMIFSQIVVSILLSCFVISAAAEMPRLFDAEVRVTGVSFGYNLGLCLLGGTAPMIAILLIDYTEYLIAPCFYLLLCCFFGFFSSIMVYKYLYKNKRIKNIGMAIS